jgi:hypothetical protein
LCPLTGSKQKAPGEKEKHILPSSFYGKGGTKFPKTLNDMLVRKTFRLELFARSRNLNLSKCAIWKSQTISAKPDGVGAASQPWIAKGEPIWIADAHRGDGKRFIVLAFDFVCVAVFDSLFS